MSKLRNNSIHWTHHLAIRDRVVPNVPPADADAVTRQCKIADLELAKLLPSLESNLAIERDFIVLVSSIVVKFLPAFFPLKDMVIHHIPHKYTKEMASKSEVVRAHFLEQCLII